MLIMFRCTDKPGSTKAKRDEYLVAHLQWVEANMQNIKVAGPLREHEHIIGSLYILEAETQHEGLALMKSDPYFKADIWQPLEIAEFNDYAGTWVGGKNWPGA